MKKVKMSKAENRFQDDKNKWEFNEDFKEENIERSLARRKARVTKNKWRKVEATENQED